MQIIVEIVGCWVLISCSLGVLFTWAFFYPGRRAKALQEVHDRWIVMHPTSPLEMMPEWMRWEDTTGSDFQRQATNDCETAAELCRTKMLS